MQLSPKNVFKTRTPDGKVTTTEEWDYGTIAGFNLAQYFLILIMTVTLASIVSPLLLVISVFMFKGKGWGLNLIGVIGGCYFLYDAAHGWLSTMALSFGMSEQGINTMLAITGASILAHLLLMLFGNSISEFVNKGDQQTRLTIIVSIMFVIGFVFTSNAISPGHKGWLNENLKQTPVEQYVPERTAEDQNKLDHNEFDK